MTKKETLIKTIQENTLLPFYIRNAKIDILNDDVNDFFNIPSNNYSYQTKKHHHTILYKPILLLDEKI
mgnify:CR=1 FL=1